LTIKYRKPLFKPAIEGLIAKVLKGLKERYSIEVYLIGFDKNHIHILCRFLPKYSGTQVVRLIKSITSQIIFKQVPAVKQWLWGGEFWSDGYYISTVSGRGDHKIIEQYIKKQGREADAKQLRLFEF